MKDEEVKKVAEQVAFILKQERGDDRPSFTDEEAKELKDLAQLKKNTVKAVIWIGGILVALALKDIWTLFWTFLTEHLSFK